jgi:primase-polymerase (primpol)-like protein
LTSLDQWVCWRREERDGKATKVPVEPATGGYASTTEPDTWTDVETALEAVETANADGIGFVFTDDDQFVGVDLDDCRDPESGTIDDWARDVVTRLDSYAEVSPSGTGVHVIVEGELPEGRSRKGDVEMYETSRFFTVTGDRLDQTPSTVRRRSDAIRGVHADYVQPSTDTDGSDYGSRQDAAADVDLGDEAVLERARAAENGDRFDALWRGQTSGYDSHSEADMALCLHLAFWTSGDPGQMDALFRRSGLMREKWDEVHYADGATYGERTIERALERVDAVYDPDRESEGNETNGAEPKSLTEIDDDDVDDGSSTGTTAESVYLEECNRLLNEKVRTQLTTIEQQAARIDQLEGELERLREQVAAREQIETDSRQNPNPWGRIRNWL